MVIDSVKVSEENTLASSPCYDAG